MLKYLLCCGAFLLLLAQISHTQSCSGSVNLQTQTGNITSNNGGTYAINSNCFWYLSPPNSSFTYVTITFTSFKTEQNWDFVNVYDGPSNSSTRLLRYSGTTLPSPYIYSSTQPYMTIWFTSDNVNNAAGFSLTYVYKQTAPFPCSGVTTASSSATSLSLTFPAYDGTLQCSYILPSTYSDTLQTYTASIYLDTMSDPDNALDIEVYSDSDGSGFPFATYTSSSALDQKVTTNYYYEIPYLYVKITFTGPTDQSTSFKLKYSFKKQTTDTPGISNPSGLNVTGMVVGIIVGTFALICIIWGMVFVCGRRSRGYSGRNMFMPNFVLTTRTIEPEPVVMSPPPVYAPQPSYPPPQPVPASQPAPYVPPVIQEPTFGTAYPPSNPPPQPAYYAPPPSEPMPSEPQRYAQTQPYPPQSQPYPPTQPYSQPYSQPYPSQPYPPMQNQDQGRHVV